RNALAFADANRLRATFWTQLCVGGVEIAALRDGDEQRSLTETPRDELSVCVGHHVGRRRRASADRRRGTAKERDNGAGDGTVSGRIDDPAEDKAGLRRRGRLAGTSQRQCNGERNREHHRRASVTS